MLSSRRMSIAAGGHTYPKEKGANPPPGSAPHHLPRCSRPRRIGARHRSLNLRAPATSGLSVVPSSGPAAASPITWLVVHSSGSLGRGSGPRTAQPKMFPERDGGPQPYPSEGADWTRSRSFVRSALFLVLRVLRVPPPSLSDLAGTPKSRRPQAKPSIRRRFTVRSAAEKDTG